MQRSLHAEIRFDTLFLDAHRSRRIYRYHTTEGNIRSISISKKHSIFPF